MLKCLVLTKVRGPFLSFGTWSGGFVRMSILRIDKKEGAKTLNSRP